MKVKSLIPKVVDGNIIITNKDDYDEVHLSVNEMEDILNNAYQKGKSDLIKKAHCSDADCFECAFGSAEECLLKDE